MIGWLVIHFHFWNLPIKIKSYLGMRFDWTPFWVQQTRVKSNHGNALGNYQGIPIHLIFISHYFLTFFCPLKITTQYIEWLLLQINVLKWINFLFVKIWGINIQKDYLVVCIIATRLRQYHTIIGKVGL
jgi:hypothetical protein